MTLINHKGFTLLTEVTTPNSTNNTFTPHLHQFLKQFIEDHCGLSKIVCVKQTYNSITDTYRARIDSKKNHHGGSGLIISNNNNNNNNCGGGALAIVIYETDYIEFRPSAGVVMHLGRRLDPEVKSGSGLVGRIADSQELAEWGCWVDEL